MNLLSLRNIIFQVLNGLSAPAAIKDVTQVNPVSSEGDWGVLVVANDGSGTGATRNWLVTVREAQHIAQIRDRKDRPWGSLGKSLDAAEVAHRLDELMQKHGFYFSELHAHREDLVAGHVLTADDGYEFRVVLEGREQ